MEFHPFASDYPLMPEQELNQLAEGMKADGFDKRFPIVLYQGMVLDGRNRLLASGKAQLTPIFVDFYGADEDAKLFVQRANEDRRHLKPAWLKKRREERVARVAASRVEGKSTRVIAEAEGISQKQVCRDIEKATESGVSVENVAGKVVGKDKKIREAKRPDRHKGADIADKADERLKRQHGIDLGRLLNTESGAKHEGEKTRSAADKRIANQRAGITTAVSHVQPAIRQEVESSFISNADKEWLDSKFMSLEACFDSRNIEQHRAVIAQMRDRLGMGIPF